MGLFSSLKKAAGFELWHGIKATKELLSHPQRALTGAIDPIGTKIVNKVTGSKFKPIVNQLGGATGERYAQYGKDPGLAPLLQKVAGTITGSYAAAGLGLGPGGGDLVNRAAGLADAKFGAGPPSPLPALDGRAGEVSDVTHGWEHPDRPLRRFERTSANLFSNLRTGADPMKITRITGTNARAVGVAPPTTVTPVKTPSPIGSVSSAPKTPPAVNAARQGLADVKRIPRRPTRAASY